MPYIPVLVAGERLPILVKKDNLMQWQEAEKKFATCESVKYGPQPAKQSAAAMLMLTLCGDQQAIYSWASQQLPHENEITYSPAPQ